VEELEELVALHHLTPSRQVCFMYGFQAEPTPVESNNLSRLQALRGRFPGYRFGFMDHTDGGSDDASTLALMALSFGVECIEKHISLDRTLQLEDYASALAPEQFQIFVQRIRRLEKALGNDNLELTPVEREYRRKAVKLVVANRRLQQGKKIIPEDVCLKRVSRPSPSSLIYRIEQVVGRTVVLDIECNQQIEEEMLS